MRTRLLLCTVALAACAKGPPPVPPPAATPAPMTPAGPDEAAEVARLQARLQALRELQALMKGVVDDVTRAQAQAKDTQDRLAALTNKLPAEQVAAIMREVKQQMMREGALPDAGPMSTLQARAKDIDGRLRAAMQPEVESPADPPAVRERKDAVARAQEGTAPLATATQVSFKATTLIEQMHRALPLLEQQIAADAP